MEYSVITCTDGNNVVREEHITDKNRGKDRFHYWCHLLFNDKNFTTGMIRLMDSNLDTVEGMMQFIQHEVQATPAPTPEETPAEDDDVENEPA